MPTTGALVNGYYWNYTLDVSDNASIGDNSFTNGNATTSGTNIADEIIIPSTLDGYAVTAIGLYAFNGCTGLTLLTIPNSVTSIQTSAFEGCSGLTSLTIGNSVTSIGEGSFKSCSGLTLLTIPNSVTSIGGSAFESCSGLTSVTTGNSVTSIGSYAFYSCTSLTSFTIPNSVTSIQTYVFRGCTGLTSITIPNSVTSIDEGAFFSCTGLTSVTISNSVKSIGIGAFRSCTILTSLTIGNSVTSIGDYAFFSCTGLTSLTIPNSVTSIDIYAFQNCSGLMSATIGNSTITIGEGAFKSCTGLTSLTIPTSVTSIGNNAFQACSGLASLTIQDSIMSIGNSAFQSCTVLTSATMGNAVISIGIEAFRFCTSLTSINIPDSVTTIDTDAFRQTSANLVIAMNTGKFGYTSPTAPGPDVSFFGNTSVTLVIPSSPPTMTITSTTPGVTSGSTTNNSSIALTFTSSASTTDFVSGDITLTNGSLFSSFAGIGTDGSVYTATFTPTGQGACTIGVSAYKFTSASQNNVASNTFNWTFDSVSPSMTITSTTPGVASGSTTKNEFIELTFTSTEATNNFLVGDISVTNGTLSNFAGIGTDGKVYNARFTPTGPGTCTIGVLQGAYTDAAKNLNNLATQFNWTLDDDYGILINSAYIPTPISFVDNKLTIANGISSTDTDVVSFQLTAGNRLYPLSVSTFTGTGTVTYTLDISGGSNVKSGTFSSAGPSLLPGDGSLTASVNTTYILTMTANASITYTIVGNLDYGTPVIAGYSLTALNEQICGASNFELNDYFGLTVAISGDYAIIGAYQEDGSSNQATDSGAAYIFERDGSGNWIEKILLRASNAARLEEFGSSVSISGNYAIVGSSRSVNGGDYGGAAYIFERDGSGNWIQKPIIRASNLSWNSQFGTSVAISGTYAIVGARLEDGTSENGDFNNGAAYIFERDGSGNWIQKPILRASNLGQSDTFGNAVAISGNYAIVGAAGEDGSSTELGFNSGAAYIFERTSGTWSEKAILRANNLGRDDIFGASVAISGNYAIVGAGLEDGSSDQFNNSGAAYIFERDGSGNWIQKTILRASNLGGSDVFGGSVAISGNYAMVGAVQEDGISADPNFDSGAAYIFERDVSGNWNEKNIIRASNLSQSGSFGNSVAISGTTFLVGSQSASITSTSIYRSGAAYFYSANPIYTYIPTPVAFVNNAIVISNSLGVNDTDVVSLVLNSGTTLFPLNVSAFTGTGTVTYKLDLSGGANIVTGTFNSAGVNILTSGAVTAAVNATYILTLTANASITYSIFGLLITGSFTYTKLVTSGFTTAQLANAGYNIVTLKSNGVTDTQLLSGGYTFNQFLSIGILPTWSSDASANHLIKSYVKDFVDVSGSIVLRQNSKLYVNGNLETVGNVSLNHLFVTADASFNRHIFVGGDVSMNGKVATRGDLSINGTVTKCAFNNSSIPKSTFIGTVPDGPNYTTPKIVYDQTFQANDDVSMNGLTIAANNVKVSGNIVFGDGTVMNTYDNNILSTNPNVFKSSTFTSLDICGNLVAGSYATSSDYRIKTNIVELDETYNVDKLRPVKYYQTQINREKYGLIAHELQEHYPDLVVGEKDGSELQRVNYTGLIAILINEIKRIKRELTELERGVAMTI